MKLNGNQNQMLVALGFFTAGVICASVVNFAWQSFQPASKARPLRESNISTNHSEYQFIDPLIGIRGVDNSSKYDGLKSQVANYITQQAPNGLIIASVDFRDIDEPGGFILNGTELYTPASLNKVPVMMAYFKLGESDSSILSEKLLYTGETDSNAVEDIKSAVHLIPGNSYTIAQLIEHMIRYSDNNAADMLTQHLRDTNNLLAYTSVFGDLGVDPSVLSKYTDNMSVQAYSMFLRALYNATYLNREDSERALRLLSETDFSEGIESGVPNSILVAEKFGEVKMTDSSGVQLGKEINNCGIVYYPDHPYLLCIMTKGEGNDIKGLESVVAGVSRIVYQGMQTLYP
jgi:beta-lactamase class A